MVKSKNFLAEIIDAISYTCNKRFEFGLFKFFKKTEICINAEDFFYDFN